jgi:hypothetical protein
LPTPPLPVSPDYAAAPPPPPPQPYVPPPSVAGAGSSGGVSNLKKLLIPLGALAVIALAAIVFAVLMMTGVVNIGGSGTSDAAATPAVSGDEISASPSVSPVEETPSPTPSTPSPSPTPESSPPETPDPSPEPIAAPALEIPGSGGSVRVTEPSDVMFTPIESGLWILYTTDNGDSDPAFYVYDQEGVLVDFDDDSGEDYNAYLEIVLEAGLLYKIEVYFYDDNCDCTLVAELAPDLPEPEQPDGDVIPGFGGHVWVSNETDFIFTPERSGIWEFRTSYYDDCDPYLILFEYPDEYIISDDDGAGDLNALISIYLESGRTFVINASDAYDGPCDYILSVLYVISEPDEDEDIATQLYGIADYADVISESQDAELTAVLRELFDGTGIIVRIITADFVEAYEDQFVEALYQTCDDNYPPRFGLCVGLNVNIETPQIQFLRFGSSDFSGIISDEHLQEVVDYVTSGVFGDLDSPDVWYQMLLFIVWSLW